MKKLIKRLLALKIICNFFLASVGKRIVLSLPPQLHFKLLSGFVVPVEMQIAINGQDFSIFSSIKDDHFYNAYRDKMQNWEVETIAAWIDSVEPNTTVVDVGAYLGIYSIVALKHGAKNVVAYEPNFLTADKLRENLRLNNCHDKTLVREVALSDSEGLSKLMVPKGRKLSSGAQLMESEIVRDLSAWEYLSNTETNTLDKDLIYARIDKLSAIKIDTEGYELQVLAGSVNTLRTFKPSVLVEIFELDTLKIIISFMNNLGYSDPEALDGLDARKFVDELSNAQQARNYLFSHPEYL